VRRPVLVAAAHKAVAEMRDDPDMTWFRVAVAVWPVRKKIRA
jgi:hypothetical protein